MATTARALHLAALALSLKDCFAGSTLALHGDDSAVHFVETGARLTASCPSSSDAAVTFLEPGFRSVKAHMHGVPRTCTGSPMYLPCASPNLAYPRLFYCSWSSAQGTAPVTVGPLRANSEKEVDADGLTLGWAVFVECPLPSGTMLASLMASDDPGDAVDLTLRLSFHAPSVTTPIELRWSGVPHKNVIKAVVTSDALTMSNATGSAARNLTWVSVKRRRGADGEFEDQIYASASLSVGRSLRVGGDLTAGGNAEVVGDVTVGGDVAAVGRASFGKLHVGGQAVASASNGWISLGDLAMNDGLSNVELRANDQGVIYLKSGKAGVGVEPTADSKTLSIAGGLSTTGDVTFGADVTVGGRLFYAMEAAALGHAYISPGSGWGRHGNGVTDCDDPLPDTCVELGHMASEGAVELRLIGQHAGHSEGYWEIKTWTIWCGGYGCISHKNMVKSGPDKCDLWDGVTKGPYDGHLDERNNHVQSANGAAWKIMLRCSPYCGAGMQYHALMNGARFFPSSINSGQLHTHSSSPCPA